MTVHEILHNKTYKAKEKVLHLSEGLQNNNLPLIDFIEEIHRAKESDKANCIEALAYVAEQQPSILTEEALTLLIQTLGSAKAARVKWESAKAIAYLIPHYPNQLTDAVNQLILHINDEGTVVRWSIATALAEIVKMKSPSNTHLIPLLKNQLEIEEKNSIKKIYQKALKEVTRTTK